MATTGRTAIGGCERLLGGLAALCMILAPWSDAHTDQGPDPVNSALVAIIRADDFPHGEIGVYLLEIEVVIPGVPGVTSVTVTTGGGMIMMLRESDDGTGRWNQDITFFDLETMKPALDGTWIISITGDSPSTSTFTFDATLLQDSDFFATPTDVSPANDSTDVPPDVVFSWSDPTGPESPYALIVYVAGPNDNDQDDDSILGTLNITDTSWDPPEDLEIGSNEFGVLYANYDDAGLASMLKVTDGSIKWGESMYAPPDYPVSTPFLALGSETIVGFMVANCPADLTDDGTIGPADLAVILGNWGPVPPNDPIADLNDDGVVGPADLAIVLGNWGPCQ